MNEQVNDKNSVKFNSKNFIGIAIAALLIIAAIFGSKINSATKSEPEIKAPEAKKIIVQAQVISPSQHAPILKSTASVEAWQESQLAAQVGGRLEWICDCLETGNEVKKGTVLAKIEAVDYLVAVAQAKQAMADAKQRIAEEEARSEQAQVDWEQLNLGEPTELALRKPQLETANATLRRRELELQQANRNLKRTQIKAPYDGIITARMTNVGNFINTGSSIGTILNTEKVQIRFALNQDDVRKIDPDNNQIMLNKSGVEKFSWPASIQRIDSVIDPKTRLVNVIAEVSKPFDPETHEHVLRVGTFVSAEFPGSVIDDVYALPNSALLSDNSVYTVNANNEIQIFTASLLHRNPDSVLVAIPDANTQTLNIITQGQGAYSSGLKVSLEDSTRSN
jgi:RND family efflux transporter MFP subunit